MKHRSILVLGATALLVLGTILYLNSGRSAQSRVEIASIPHKIDPECRDGTAKIYDECSNQLELYALAKEAAQRQGKTLLVTYGAEWCIWCHVFEAYIHGEHTKFDHVYASPDAPDDKFIASLYERGITQDKNLADDLNSFVAANFVVANIENRFADDGYSVLEDSGAELHTNGSIPFVYAVDENGKYIDQIYWNEVEVRRDTDDWFRGYDREKLLQALTSLIPD